MFLTLAVFCFSFFCFDAQYDKINISENLVVGHDERCAICCLAVVDRGRLGVERGGSGVMDYTGCVMLHSDYQFVAMNAMMMVCLIVYCFACLCTEVIIDKERGRASQPVLRLIIAAIILLVVSAQMYNKQFPYAKHQAQTQGNARAYFLFIRR